MNHIDTEQLLRSVARTDAHLTLDERAILRRGHLIVRRRRLAAAGAAALLVAAALAAPTLFPTRDAVPAASPSPSADPGVPSGHEGTTIDIPVPDVPGSTNHGVQAVRLTATPEPDRILLEYQFVQEDGTVPALTAGSDLSGVDITWSHGSIVEGVVMGVVEGEALWVQPLPAQEPGAVASDVALRPLALTDGRRLTAFVIQLPSEAAAEAVTDLVWGTPDGTAHRGAGDHLPQATFSGRDGEIVVLYKTEADSLTLFAHTMPVTTVSLPPAAPVRFDSDITVSGPTTDGTAQIRRSAGVLPAEATDITITWAPGVDDGAFHEAPLTDDRVWYAEATVPPEDHGLLGTITWADPQGQHHTIEV